MKTTDIPARITGIGAIGDIFNRIFTCLKRRTLIAGPGISLVETEHGVRVSLVNQTARNVMFVKACLADGTECYLPIMAAGDPFRTNDGTTEAVAVIEEDVPDNSRVLS